MDADKSARVGGQTTAQDERNRVGCTRPPMDQIIDINGAQLKQTDGNLKIMSFRSSYAGGCYTDGVALCIPEPTALCDEGTWQSAHFLRANGGERLRPCSTDIENAIIGRCDGEDGFCSNLATRCNDPSSFVELDRTCTVTLDKKKGVLTAYGKCDERCSWSPESCLDGELWTPTDSSCTAEKVHTGACFSGYAFCTVSPANCVNPVEPYLSFQEVRDQNGIDCFLSEIVSTSRPTYTPRPTSAPIQYPGSESVALEDTPDFSMPGNEAGISTGAIVGITLLGVALGLLCGIGSYYHERKKEAAEKRRVRKPHAVRVVEAEELCVESDEDLSVG